MNITLPAVCFGIVYINHFWDWSHQVKRCIILRVATAAWIHRAQGASSLCSLPVSILCAAYSSEREAKGMPTEKTVYSEALGGEHWGTEPNACRAKG